MKYHITSSSTEGLAVQMAAIGLPTFPQIYANLIKRLGRPIKKGIVSVVEFSCSRMGVAVYEQTGGILSKKYTYLEDLEVNDDEFFALRQFYYQCHVVRFGAIFNIVDIVFESDGSKLKVSYGVSYNPKWDGEASSGGGARHAALTNLKQIKASKIATLEDEIGEPAGLTAIKS